MPTTVVNPVGGGVRAAFPSSPTANPPPEHPKPRLERSRASGHQVNWTRVWRLLFQLDFATGSPPMGGSLLNSGTLRGRWGKPDRLSSPPRLRRRGLEETEAQAHLSGTIQKGCPPFSGSSAGAAKGGGGFRAGGSQEEERGSPPGSSNKVKSSAPLNSGVPRRRSPGDPGGSCAPVSGTGCKHKAGSG